MILFFIKVFIGIIGVILTFVYFIASHFKKYRHLLKFSFVIFFTTIGIILLITMAEFAFRDRSNDLSEKQTLLVAMREASLGGIHLRVYTDSTFEFGNQEGVMVRGKIKVKSDTLLLMQDGRIKKLFVLDNNTLHEVTETRVHFLEVESNLLIKKP